MPKRIGNIYEQALKFSKIKHAFYRTARRKKKTKDFIKFELYLEDNIFDIYKRLKNETYVVGNYRAFYVYEPKERLIFSLPFYDRVVQQFYVYEYIMPYMIPKFIKTSFACIPGRGVHTCVKTVRQYMNIVHNKWKKPYIVKFDIAKFFYSIDRKVLFEIIKKYYKDKKFLRLTEQFINFVPDNEIVLGKGLPIGNYTSQYFANIYLNELDHFIKEELKQKYYVRFMDDGLLMVEDKEEAKKILGKIENFVNDKLCLKLNNKSGYFPLKKGVVFCGYKIYLHNMKIKRANIKRIQKRIKHWNHEWKLGNNNFKYWHQSFHAWKGYAMFADSKKLVDKLEKSREFIYRK